jgi:threonine dehydratase
MTRWKGMVTKAEGTPADATVEVTEVSGVKVHTIEMTGAYVDGGMSGAGTKRDNWTFRGAIIETPGQLTFIRMTGPADIMEGQNTAWNEIVKSMR